jgi:hypothetical protein
MSDTPTSVMHAMVGAIMGENNKHGTNYWKTVSHLDQEQSITVHPRDESEWAFRVRAGVENVFVHFPSGLFDADFVVESDGPEFRHGQRVRKVRVSQSKILVVMMKPDGSCFYYTPPSRYLESESLRTAILHAMALAQARMLLRLGVAPADWMRD